MYKNPISSSISYIESEKYRDHLEKLKNDHFFQVIREFEKLCYQDGAAKVLANLDEEAYWLLKKELNDSEG